MNILYTCDNNYIWLMGISVISLFENNRHIENLSVYLLGKNITNNNTKILEEISDKYNRKITIINTPEIDIPEVLTSSRWPLSAFTRLFSGQLLPLELHRVLYLDCDTIIKGDIHPLDTVNIDSYVCGGVKDCLGRMYKKNIGLFENDPYINAGVLLFNLNELRKININQSIENYVKHYLNLINYADQDILNGIFKNKIKILDPQYNVMTINVVYTYEEIITLRKPTNYYSKADINKACSNPTIIHYTTNMRVIRPWFNNSNHPLEKDFKKYLEISPWKEKDLPYVCFNSKTDKVISAIDLFPKSISIKLLGLVHSKLKPMYIRLKSMKLSSIRSS